MRREIVIVTLVVFVWMGTLAQAEEQPVGMSHSTDMIGKLVKNLNGKNVGKKRAKTRTPLSHKQASG